MFMGSRQVSGRLLSMLPAEPENVLTTLEGENTKFIVKNAVARTTIIATTTTAVWAPSDAKELLERQAISRRRKTMYPPIMTPIVGITGYAPSVQALNTVRTSAGQVSGPPRIAKHVLPQGHHRADAAPFQVEKQPLPVP
jgi:hypothetical protein